MKNYILLALSAACIGATASAQSVKIGDNYTVSYNAAAAKNIGFSVDVSDKSGYLATCQGAAAAIHFLTKELGVKLSDNQKAAIYTASHEEVPEWLRTAAGIKQL